MKPNGSAAWVQGASIFGSDQNAPLQEVRKLSVTQRQGSVLLDLGSGISSKSLKLSADGTSVTWTRDGSPKTATLG